MAKKTVKCSAVPGPIEALVEVFSSELSDVEFPGVNAERLATLAAELQATADALAEAEEVLGRARTAHLTARDALAAAADRGIAYARVYASDDDALSATLAAIPLGRSRRAKAPKDKRRVKRAPPKPEPVAQLPISKKGRVSAVQTA